MDNALPLVFFENPCSKLVIIEAWGITFVHVRFSDIDHFLYTWYEVLKQKSSNCYWIKKQIEQIN